VDKFVENLQRKFYQMEIALAQFETQSTFLTQQLSQISNGWSFNRS